MKNSFPKSLQNKLEIRKQNNAFRELSKPDDKADFSSNDYLGFSRSESIFQETHNFLIANNFAQNGATGSRLISGNHPIYSITESYIAKFHEVESALIFNSGYDANVGFFSCVPQKDDLILFDELSHASIRDGIQISIAKSYKFQHNNFEDLERLITKFREKHNNVYVVTESVFSMDGDSPNLEELTDLCDKYQCFLIVDEAHTLGVFGEKGEGLIQSLNLHQRIFARIMTFGKGLGTHGAAVLGSQELRDYLINFSRSFIYTTGLAPHSIATILTAYKHLEKDQNHINKLRENITIFNQHKNLLFLKPLFVRSKSAIQCAIIPGNEKVKSIAAQMQEKGFGVKAILSPTVPEGQERLRFCLHSFNTQQEIETLLTLLNNFVF